MKLFCPECGAPVPAEKINVDGLVAFCPGGDNLFSFSQSDVGNNHKPQKNLKPLEIQVYEYGDHKVMIYRWFNWEKFILLAPITLFWNTGILVFIIGFIVARILICLPLLTFHIGMGLWLIHQLVSLICNRTKISLSPGEIEISHGPIFATGKVSIPVGEIKNFYCVYQPGNQYRRKGLSLNPSINCLYELHADLGDGSDILMVGTDEEDFARFIGQRVRHYIELDGLLPFKDAHGKALSYPNF